MLGIDLSPHFEGIQCHYWLFYHLYLLQCNCNLLYLALFFIDATALSGGTLGQGSGPIYVVNLRCVGNEDALVNCSYSADTSRCMHAQDAALSCRGQLNNDRISTRYITSGPLVIHPYPITNVNSNTTT